MPFDTITFWLFFAVAWAAWRLLPFTLAKSAALILSLVFYGWWNPWYVPLIVLSAVVDYLAGGRIHASDDPGTRKRWLALSLISNLGLLAVFKYGDFALRNLGWLGSAVGHPLELPVLSWVIPVGISFYTFQTMSYSLDIYRRRLVPVQSFRDFFLYVAFFPQLVAGPIVRAAELLPQFAKRRRLLPVAVQEGFYCIIWGLFMKVVIADSLAPQVNQVYGNLSAHNGPEVWLATIYFSCQIFADFAGYSSIAIGCAYLLGLRFPRNFDYPYISAGLSEFWTRWHITLSRWLRDYLYISLGGNRKGAGRTAVNLMVTMLLGGLWHGTSWTFVVWGGLHGVGLCIERLLRGDKRDPRHDARRSGRIGLAQALKTGAAMLIVYVFILFTWVFFRAASFANAGIALRKMFVEIVSSAPIHFVQGKRFLLLVAVVVLMHGGKLAEEWFDLRLGRYGKAVAAGLMLFCLFIVTRPSQSAFIYFQF